MPELHWESWRTVDDERSRRIEADRRDPNVISASLSLLMPELAPNPDRQPQRPKTFATECLKSLLQLAPHVDPATVVPPEASAVEQTSRRDAENSGEHLIECALGNNPVRATPGN